MKNNYLDRYIDFSNYKKYDEIFLCNEFVDDEIFKLFIPNRLELLNHAWEGYYTLSWGSKPEWEIIHPFTPLRQNIVLLMAAINNET